MNSAERGCPATAAWPDPLVKVSCKISRNQKQKAAAELERRRKGLQIGLVVLLKSHAKQQLTELLFGRVLWCRANKEQSKAAAAYISMPLQLLEDLPMHSAKVRGTVPDWPLGSSSARDCCQHQDAARPMRRRRHPKILDLCWLAMLS